MKTMQLLQGGIAIGAALLVGAVGSASAQVRSPVIETKGTTPLTVSVVTRLTATVTTVTVPSAAPVPLVPATGAWTVKREWNRREIARFVQWITNIYEKKSSGTTRQRQAKLSTIVTDREMNLLLQEGFADDNNDPRKIPEAAINVMNAANACGTLPILTFIYYSAVRGLPVSFTSVDGHGGDIRYSRGNKPVKRFDPLGHADLATFVRSLFFGDTHYTTGNWRTAPDMEGTDTVPVAVSPESTLPGLTLLYNPDGHGLMVGRVSTTGNVNMLDAHPDNSITCGQSLASVESVVRAIPEKGRERWYAGWRMIRLARCVTDAQGKITGIRPYSNAEMRTYGFSDEQFTDILAMRKGLPVMINGQPVRVESYPEYVRRRLQTAQQLDPARLIDDWANQLHTLFTERATFVSQSWANVLSGGAIKLPDQKNIYQADGRWEDWSSPSSDCDRKGAYFLGVDQLEQMVRDFDPARSNLVLTGFGRSIRTPRDLALAIIEHKRRAFAARAVTFTTSRGARAWLTLDAIEKRLFLMSFDPNHAPEIRWGASPDSPEAAGYRRIDTPLESGGELSALEAYRKEQRLRYRLCRKEGITSFDDSDNPLGPRPLLEERLTRWIGQSIAVATPRRAAGR